MAGLMIRSNGFEDVPKTYNLRIPQTYFIGFISAFLTVAIIAALVRTSLHVYHYKTIGLDDYILLFACCCLGAAAGVAWTIKDLVYLQIYVGLGWQDVDDTFFPHMLDFEKRIVVCSMLVWTAIYAVKLSFLIFFKRLVHCVRSLEIQWWVCFGFVAAGTAVSIPLVLIICPHFGEDYMNYCPIVSQIAHEVIYLQTSVAIDVLTDVLLVSIPVRLLWNLQMPVMKKIVLGSILSLSIFTIIIAIIRTSMAPLPNGVIDTSWLVFWQGMEAAVAVLMISLTAFPGLFSGNAGSKTPGRRDHGNHEAAKSSDASGRIPLVSGSSGRPSRRYYDMYDEDNILLPDDKSLRRPQKDILDVEKGVVRQKTVFAMTRTSG